MKRKTYKYNIVNKFGIESDWSGKFRTLKQAKAWYKEHGKPIENEERYLKLIVADFYKQ